MNKALNVVFAITLVFSATQASLFKSDPQVDRFGGLKAIQDIESSKFGRQLLDTIALQMKNETPLQDIAGLLADIRADLVAQQSNDDTLQEERRADCEQSIDEFEHRIQTADTNVAEAVAQIGSLRTQITDLKALITNYATQLDMVSSHMETCVADRATDAADFAERTARTEQTVEALQMIIPKLQALGHVAPAQALLQLSKIGKSNPIAALMEVASTIDQDRLATVVEKMEELLESMQASLVEDAQNEADAIVAYTGLMNDLEATHAMLTQAHTEAVSNREQAESKLASTERFLDEQRAEAEAAREGLAAKKEQCALWEANYQTTKEARTAERHVVEMVQQILAERLATMSEYLADRVNN